MVVNICVCVCVCVCMYMCVCIQTVAQLPKSTTMRIVNSFLSDQLMGQFQRKQALNTSIPSLPNDLKHVSSNTADQPSVRVTTQGSASSDVSARRDEKHRDRRVHASASTAQWSNSNSKDYDDVDFVVSQRRRQIKAGVCVCMYVHARMYVLCVCGVDQCIDLLISFIFNYDVLCMCVRWVIGTAWSAFYPSTAVYDEVRN